MDSLQEISVENWVDIQKEFLKDWPRGISTYHLLETQKKYRELGCDYGFKVYCPFGRVDSGIVALNVKNKLYELVIQSPKLDTCLLEEALITTKVIDWNRNILIPFAPDHITELVKRFVPKLGHVKSDCIIYCNASVYVIYKDEPTFGQVTLPAGFRFGEVNNEHIPLIDSVWPHKYEGSEWYFKTLIQTKGGYGLFKNNGLISWVFIYDCGKLTHMYTIEEERNKGYGEALLKIVSNMLLQEGKDVLACCVEGNPAYKLYEKNRFHRLNPVFWLDLVPKIE